MNDPRDVIIRPVVSEKSYALLDENVYTFIVHPSANKIEIRQAVETLFNVEVVKVNITGNKYFTQDTLRERMFIQPAAWKPHRRRLSNLRLDYLCPALRLRASLECHRRPRQLKRKRVLPSTTLVERTNSASANFVCVLDFRVPVVRVSRPQVRARENLREPAVLPFQAAKSSQRTDPRPLQCRDAGR